MLAIVMSWRYIVLILLGVVSYGAVTARAKKRPPDKADKGVQLAFVLLSAPKMPKPDDVVRAFAKYAPRETLRPEVSQGGEKTEVATFGLGSHGRAFIALMPIAVPKGEADEVAQYSLSALGTQWKLGPHAAHLVVSLQSPAGTSRLDRMQRLTSLLAAVVEASPAVGVYWGDAHATHDPKFFLMAAGEPGVVPRITLWSGVSVAQQGPARASLVSLGMKQLGLPNLMVTAPKDKTGEALQNLYDMLAYSVSEGAAPPEGDTVGRNESEKLKVRYVASPVEAGEKVWRVDYP